jgi:RES domain-containing protein
MIVFRLSKSTYTADLSGKGAEMSGGRWNSKGTAMVYTSQSKALCTVEIAVHTPLGNLPLDYTLVTISIPDELTIQEITPDQLPINWNALAHIHTTQLIGDQFIKSAIHPLLKVPSAVIQGEYNYLINPRHPESRKISIQKNEPFNFDSRLFVK